MQAPSPTNMKIREISSTPLNRKDCKICYDHKCNYIPKSGNNGRYRKLSLIPAPGTQFLQLHRNHNALHCSGRGEYRHNIPSCHLHNYVLFALSSDWWQYVFPLFYWQIFQITPPCCTAAMQLFQAMRRLDPLLALSRVLHTADESNVCGEEEGRKPSHMHFYTHRRCITNVKNELVSLLLQLHPLLFWSHSQLHHILCRTQQLLSGCLWYLKTQKRNV